MHEEIGRLELIRESLVAVVNEMRANVIHSSYSSIIYEGHDFSCALVAGDGRLVAQGVDDNPIHNFSVPYSTAEVVRVFGDDIHEGDIFFHNDPYTGGTHLNDVLMLYPVFHDGRSLALFAATRCHWGDVGGMTPGSLSGPGAGDLPGGAPHRAHPDLRSRADERSVAHPALRQHAHRPRAPRGLQYHARDVAQGGGARRAAVRPLRRRGTPRCNRGADRARRKGDAGSHRRDSRTGRTTRRAISTATAMARRRSAAASPSPSRASASSPTSPAPRPGRKGPTNVGPAMAFNAVASIVKSCLDPDTPVNHGSFNPIEIVNPPGSFLNATLPAPCGGMVECRALMCGLVVSALGQALPERRVGDLKGGGNHVYVSGPHPDRDDIFLLYEYPAAGTGATGRTDGSHGVRAFPEGDFNAVQSAEVVEAQCPVRIESYGLREGSCGDGEHRGGLGVRRDVRVLVDDASLSVLADKNIIPPFGVGGGVGGAANRFTVVRGGETVEPSPVPGKVGGFPLEAGDVVRMETSGGGGCGDPLDRAPARVRDDVALGYLGPGQARERYGVVVDGAGNVDESATADKRGAPPGRAGARRGHPLERARPRRSAAAHPDPVRPRATPRGRERGARGGRDPRLRGGPSRLGGDRGPPGPRLERGRPRRPRRARRRHRRGPPRAPRSAVSGR